MSFSFVPVDQPFPRWWGPYSPARGKKCGFRFSDRRLGVWVDHDDGRDFWFVKSSLGASKLEQLVRTHFGGGYVMLLPNGSVIKPLQEEEERGQRVYLGEFAGDVVFQTHDGSDLSLTSPGLLKPGDLWTGPTSAGLECVITADGSLKCRWYHPTTYGRDDETHTMTAANAALARGFRAARPGEQAGRVRVTAKGHVITNRQVRGKWHCFYVGQVDVDKWPHLDEWIE
jgi:hypothetical protein